MTEKKQIKRDLLQEDSKRAIIKWSTKDYTFKKGDCIHGKK